LHVHGGRSHLLAVMSSGAFWWHASQKWVVPLEGEEWSVLKRNAVKRSCVLPAEPHGGGTAEPALVLAGSFNDG